jgi:uncharacterized protein involved in type VI secretion and phage assembly
MLVSTSIDPIVDARIPAGLGGRWYGVFPALVSDINDPDGQGRVKVTLPWTPDTGSSRYEAWARVATLMGGNNRGSWFIPDVKDEVLVTFEGGDARRPYVIGGLWNGSDAPPESMDDVGNNFESAPPAQWSKGHARRSDGQEKLILETPGGQKVTLKMVPAPSKLDSNGNSVSLRQRGLPSPRR